AKRVTIGLTQQYDIVTLTVVYDGKGLPEKLARATGMGLSIMAHRAQMIGGTFQIDRAARMVARGWRAHSRLRDGGRLMKQPAEPKRKTKILIVDDHPIVREHLAQLICQQEDLTV